MRQTTLNRILSGYSRLDSSPLQPHKPVTEPAKKTSTIAPSSQDILKKNFIAFCTQDKESYFGKKTESSFEKMAKHAWNVLSGAQKLDPTNLFDKETGIFLVRFLRLQKSLSLFPQPQPPVVFGKNGNPLKRAVKKYAEGINRE